MFALRLSMVAALAATLPRSSDGKEDSKQKLTQELWQYPVRKKNHEARLEDWRNKMSSTALSDSQLLDPGS